MTIDTRDDVFSLLGALDDRTERRDVVRRQLAGRDPVTTERFLADLKSEAERYLSVDLKVSLRLAEALIRSATLARRPDHRALGFMAKGDALRVLGRYRESRVWLDEAATAFLLLDDDVGWARTRIGWLESSLFLGHGVEALEVVGPATDVLVRARQWLRAGGLNLNAGYVSYELGRYDDALGFYERAIAFYERAGVSPESRIAAEIRSGKARVHQANILTLQGQFNRALELYGETRPIWVRHGETLGVLRVDQYVADVFSVQGHFTRALRVYGDVFAAMRQSGLQVEGWRIAFSMVECYLGLNQLARARELAEEAIRAFEALAAPTDAARARFYGAIAAARQGDHARAMALLDEAVDGFARAGFVGDLGLAVLQRARLYLAEGAWSEAVEQAERAGAAFAERGALIRQLEAGLLRTRGLIALNRLDEAADEATTALGLAREREILSLVHEGHYLRGQVARRRGDLTTALAEYRAAVAGVERLQSRLVTDLRTNFLEDKLPIFREAIDLSLQLGDPRRAFSFLERAKSRALVDYLVGNPEVRLRSPDAASQELLDELARLREEHHALYHRLYGYHPTEPSQDVVAVAASARQFEAETLQAGIREREKRIAQVLERLALQRDPGFLDAVPPNEDDFACPRLDERTVLVEYYFAADQVAAFVVTHDRLEVVPLAARPGEIRRLLDRWQLNLDATARSLGQPAPRIALGRNGRGILELLYRALLAPLETALAGHERLIVAPFGPTHGVPFHALFDGRRFLVERLEVSVCPSSRLLELCVRRRQRPGLRALVVAHSDDGRLAGVLDEARAVAALLPGACFLED
ncbi:MAG TPA: CHAT domain-containing protein, partial [Chloroflexota bacterium]|nr:CHAT domain-containing protein [Chloroflexota bacterium]